MVILGLIMLLPGACAMIFGYVAFREQELAVGLHRTDHLRPADRSRRHLADRPGFPALLATKARVTMVRDDPGISVPMQTRIAIVFSDFSPILRCNASGLPGPIGRASFLAGRHASVALSFASAPHS
jgi:hypothetical protein